MFFQNSKKLSPLLIFLWIFTACAESGIIEGGKFSSSEKSNVYAFYLHDYISKDKVKEHALTLINESKGE